MFYKFLLCYQHFCDPIFLWICLLTSHLNITIKKTFSELLHKVETFYFETRKHCHCEKQSFRRDHLAWFGLSRVKRQPWEERRGCKLQVKQWRQNVKFFITFRILCILRLTSITDHINTFSVHYGFFLIEGLYDLF